MPEPAATYSVEAQISPDDQARCEDVLTRWMAALNRYDAAAMDALMHFPHVRLAGGVVTVYQQAGSNPMDLFERLRKQDGWHHSAWNEIRLVQSSPVKAHYALRYTRFRADGSVIGVYDSLYVLSLLNGEWKIQSRSSFGP
ncbi:hypothetical protein CI1B_71260 [Bradyrhizobium ivorense]|uniref:SnoaL-like domain-containing protein n=1 Tax=Bradyrhizobium ivorense TaxID=2511166 RepID=A0A508TUJ2_9BRAD|nr:hypothetical protein [Bradyrhizobium ivorense]VIO71831.1 hypothetical protein CI41S_31970 [Bradyrhizobium ivorense]VIO77943.1 hypothetical protein CI1B_71260 [Bradyrhizobium ivorense]